MIRRHFLHFLALPVVMPVARTLHDRALDLVHRGQPYQWLTFDIAAPQPFYVRLKISGRERERLIFPATFGRERLSIRLWGGRVESITVTFTCEGRTPLRLWSMETGRPVIPRAFYLDERRHQ